MSKYKAEAPVLRFPEFKVPWRTVTCGEVLNKVSVPVSVEPEKLYTQIGIRSHGKGIFHKDPVTGADLGNKRVFWVRENTLTLNIVFAWEQAVAKTSEAEKGLIASHRFPMYKGVEDETVDYLLWLFLTKRGKYLLELASPGGAGRNKTLGQKEFEKLPVPFPEKGERKKVANFISEINQKVNQLNTKLELAKQFKKGIMQKLFSQELRFKTDDGNSFPEWKILQLKEIATPVKRKAEEAIKNVMTISAGKGFLHQSDRFNQVIAGSSLDKYTLLKKNEFSYNRGNSKSYTYGCVYKLDGCDEALVPFVYRSFSLNKGHPGFFSFLFEGKYLDRQLRRIISSSARMDGLLNISEKDFYDVKVPFPTEEEQVKISDFIIAINRKINALEQQLELTQTYKQGLLQKMFI
ncbi:restriction endonuclease subunit S [Endozoicomonas atrinae]|uniref:restriction endonuclease subunit S n=1 Tax=Endozoicomonas atrinae TaxID=1333660 RepID=UPI0008266EB7|nr:restriction endonuclease subunit S [Endozoicomonas atrinae]